MSSGQQPSPLGHPLAYVRFRRSWSPADLLDGINATARHRLGFRLRRLDRRMLYRWESGRAAPEPLVQLALGSLLEVPAARLTALRWPRWLPAFEGFRPIHGWSPTAALFALGDALGNTPGSSATSAGSTDPRGYPALSGQRLVEFGESWLGAEPIPLTAMVRGALRAEEEVLGRLERHAEVLRRLDDQLPRTTLTTVTSAQLALVATLFDEGSFSAAAGRRLLLVAADLGQLAGWTALGAGRHFAAQRHFRAALYAAHAADEPSLGGYLLVCLGYQALGLGDAGTAVRLAELASDSARRCPSARARALLAGHLEVIRLAHDPATAPGPRHDLTPTHADPAWASWYDAPPVAAFTARFYPPPTDDGRLAAPRLARLAYPSGSGPQPPRGQRRLHALAEQLASGPAGGAILREVRATLDDVLPPPAAA